MKVVIDARMVGEIPHGIARYVTQMAAGLKQIQGLPYSPIFFTDPKLSKEKLVLFSPFETFPVDIPFLNPKEILGLPQLLRKLKADLYHSPSFSSLLSSSVLGFNIFSCPCPSIVTIHDLNHLTYGDWSKKIYYKTLLRSFAKSSALVMTVSKFSQSEIAKWLNYPENKIEVVYNAIAEANWNYGADQSASEEILAQFQLKSGQYFFCLSNSKPHKNVDTLVQAYKLYRSEFRTGLNSSWPLVLTTNTGLSSPGIQEIGGISEAQSGVLLSNAAGLLFPSIYEGFGLPPVEAAAARVRIAASLISPHLEGLEDLTDEEVVWVDPFDVSEWASAFQKIESGLVSRPSAASQKKILDRFSVERLGQHMDQIYRRVLKLDA